jgi:hypothetical protein
MILWIMVFVLNAGNIVNILMFMKMKPKVLQNEND